MKTVQRERFFQLGMSLFFLGLLSGFLVPAFRNPRMGLSAHLEGVMNGMFLILIGLIWNHVGLTERLKTSTFALLFWGSYANWFACVLAAIFGASHMAPIAGGAFAAEPWQEFLVSGLFISVGFSMLIAVGLLIYGLRGRVSAS